MFSEIKQLQIINRKIAIATPQMTTCTIADNCNNRK